MADRFGYGEIGLDINPCKGCEDYEPPDGCKTHGGCAKPMTNADRIRAMSDEELANWLCAHSSCHNCEGVGNCMDGLNGWLAWLQSPAGGDTH